MMRFIFYTLGILLLGWSTEIAPYYVSSLSSGTLRVLNHPFYSLEKCDDQQSPNSHMRCSHRYRFPLSEKEKISNLENTWIGLGVYISATSIYCTNNPSRKKIFGDLNSPSRALELLKTYQAFNLSDLNCTGDLIIDVWTPTSYKRGGHIASLPVIGERNQVEQVKRVVEFFTRDIFMLIAILLSVIWLFESQIIKKLGNLNQITSTISPILRFRHEWILFSLCKSGLPEILFPIISQTSIYIRLSNLLSFVAHVGTTMALLNQGRKIGVVQKIIKPIPELYGFTFLHLLGVWLVTTEYFGHLSLLTAVIGVLLLATSLLKSELKTTIPLFVSMCIEGLKLLGFTLFLPFGSTTLFLVSFWLISSFKSSLIISSKTAALLKWLASIKEKENSDAFTEVLSEFGKVINSNRLTILELRENGSCEILIIRPFTTSNIQQSLLSQSIPSVFAHALTLAKPLLHIHQSSEFALNLRKGRPTPNDIRSSLFSVYPISHNNKTLGALAITEYDAESLFEDSEKDFFNTACELFIPHLANAMWHHELKRNNLWYKKCSSISQFISKVTADEAINLDDATLRGLEEINATLNTKAMFCFYDPQTLELKNKKFSKFPDGAKNLLADTQLFALPENLQGPLPLAINNQKIVSIIDVDWIIPSLHPITQESMRISKCRSAAAIPILSVDKTTKTNSPIGVIWIESEEAGFFTPDKEAGLSLIADSFKALVESKANITQVKSALLDILPSHVAQKVIKGESARELETGFIVMIDVIGSTKIANHHGAGKWKDFISSIKENISKISEKYGYCLQCVVWDSFYFTKSGSHHSSEGELIVKFCTEIEIFMRSELHLSFVGVAYEKECIRSCIDFGDVTRDISQGNWTIIGAAMANISKLETKCKSLPGVIFHALPWLKIQGAVTTNQLHPISDFEIQCVKNLDSNHTKAVA